MRSRIAAVATAVAALTPAVMVALAAPAALAEVAGSSPGSLFSQCTGSSSAVRRAVPWALQLLKPNRVWSMTRGAGQVVAVLDSGVSATAPALSGAVLRGVNVRSGHAGDADCIGHGTFVAGIIAARPMPGSGFSGLAPGATILPVAVASSGQNDSTTSGALAAGIRYAVSSGATIIDVSIAITPGPSAALRAAVAYAAAMNVVVIAPVSAGGLSQANVVSYPAAYPGVVAVSAVDSSGAPISAGGPGVRVDLAAPGSQLLSIGPRGPGQLLGTGAALATGFVAGTAALVRAYYPRLTAARVVHRLEVTADQPGTNLPDQQFGYGVVDPYTALTTVLPEESGMRAPTAKVQPVHVSPPPPPDTWPITAALIVCGLVIAGVLAGLVSGHTIRQGRRRQWRPPTGRGDWHQAEPRSRQDA